MVNAGGGGQETREFELEEKNYERSASLWGPSILVTNPQVTNHEHRVRDVRSTYHIPPQNRGQPENLRLRIKRSMLVQKINCQLHTLVFIQFLT